MSARVLAALPSVRVVPVDMVPMADRCACVALRVGASRRETAGRVYLCPGPGFVYGIQHTPAPEHASVWPRASPTLSLGA
jgi:hypothetical protein